MTQEALKLALKWAENHGGVVFDGGGMIAVDSMTKWQNAIKETLAQTQEPVAWVDPTTLHHLKIGLEGVHLVYETEMVNSLPLYDKPQFTNSKQYLERLIRIMGTFDLATGHADTFDELLDSLESELRDVLGYYRQQRTWVGLTRGEVLDIEETTKHPLEFYQAIEAKLKEKNNGV